MTKYVFFSFVILMLGISYIFYDVYNNTVYVFDEVDYIPDYYYLECTKECNIIDVDEYFDSSSVVIMEFYPRNNLVVRDLVVLNKLNSFYYESVLLIIDKYKNILLDYDIYGVFIDKVLVYGTKNDILEFDNYKLINE